MGRGSLRIDEARLRDFIATQSEFTTVDAIDNYNGGFHINRGVPVNASLNAEIGR